MAFSNRKKLEEQGKRLQELWERWKVLQQKITEKEKYLNYLKNTKDFTKEILTKLMEEENKSLSCLADESKKIEPRIIPIKEKMENFSYNWNSFISEESKKIIAKREKKNEKEILATIFLLGNYFGVDIFLPLAKHFSPPVSTYKYNFSHEKPDGLVEYFFNKNILLGNDRLGIEFSEFFGYGKVENPNGKEGAKEEIALNEVNKNLKHFFEKGVSRKQNKDKGIYKTLSEKRVLEDLVSSNYEINVKGSLFDNFAMDIEKRINDKNQNVSNYLKKSKLRKISLFLWTTTPISLMFHKIENNYYINKPSDNEFDKLLTIYAFLKNILSKVGGMHIEFDYLTLFFDTVQFEQKDKTEIVRKIVEKDIMVNTFSCEDDGCSIILLNNIQQQSNQELKSSKSTFISLFTRSNNYSILVHLVSGKIKSFVNKKMREIKEEFNKKYKEFGPIDSWTTEELIMKGYGYLSNLPVKNY